MQSRRENGWAQGLSVGARAIHGWEGYLRAEGELCQDGKSKKSDLRDLPLPHCGKRKRGRAQCKDSYFIYANCLCNESSFLIRLVVGTLFAQSFSYSYTCILPQTH